MSRKVILAVSLSINLMLAASVLFAQRRPAATVAPLTPAAVSPVEVATVATTSPPASITNRFYWGLVESADYQQYLANLRAIGCPEKTIRDILVRDIEKTFAVRMARRLGPTNFWACGPEREAAEVVHRQELASLRREQGDLIRRLLGIDYVKRSSDFDDFAGRAVLFFVLGTSREGALEKVTEMFKLAEAAKDEIREAAGNILTPLHEAELARNRKATIDGLRAALGPAEFEEFGLRLAAVSLMDHFHLDDFKCTAAELRAIATAIYRTVGFEGLDLDPFGGRRELSNDETDQFHARLKMELGAQRYDDFLRATDSDYQALAEFATASNLPHQVAGALLDVKRMAERERARVLDDLTTPGPERRDRLRQIRQETLEAIRTQLGESAYQEYAKRGLTTWLEELGKP